MVGKATNVQGMLDIDETAVELSVMNWNSFLVDLHYILFYNIVMKVSLEP